MGDVMWLVTILSLTGNALNVKKKVSGFYVWVVSNLLWLAYDISTGLYSRAALGLVQTGFCIWGIIEWKRNRKEGDRNGV